ncbi:isochorismatase family protein [Streptomyces sp. NBC_01795]|uniref:isochorismatase family protein n=1 Tax=Streptomyces sp. NBC_01795 TaxID=2975943 RepID=UPI002DD86B77|nr:isochorismatase family protein [Streptomyces sp. NBC_01795]WSA93410.1 isochorismatase family protein [Streptomyces sp. NBC_01795]
MPGIPPIESYPLPSPHELPANTAEWAVDPNRAVLLIHDMQRYFLAPFPGTVRAELLGNVARLRERCAARGVPVAYTTQPGRMSVRDRGLLMDFWGPGMRASAEDRQVADELTPAEGDWLLTKWRYSAFFRSPLLRRLRETGRDQLILCGVYAHVGVLATAMEAYANDIRTFLVADAVADFSRDRHRMALTYAAERCAMVVSAEQLLAEVSP